MPGAKTIKKMEKRRDEKVGREKRWREDDTAIREGVKEK